MTQSSLLDLSCIVPNSTLIVGLSGGPDSVCLLHLLASLQNSYNLTIIAAHLNHEWRSNAHEDVTLCQQLCTSLKIPLIVGKGSDYTHLIKKTGSQEDHGRQMRKAFFTSIKNLYENAFIVVAHHAQDQIETFFIRLIRGSSLTGLCSMKEKEGHYLRPLLHSNKTAILDYLAHHNLAFIYDYTNDSDAFLRNRIRKYLVPALSLCDERAPQTILKTIASLQQTEDYLQTETKNLYTPLSTPEGSLLLPEFLALPETMKQRIIVHWICMYAPSFTLTQPFIKEIMRFFEHDHVHTTHHAIGTNWTLVKKKNAVFIQKV